MSAMIFEQVLWPQKDADRFWAKVQRGDECWVWRRHYVRNAGQFYFDGRDQPAPRVAMQLECNIRLPKGHVVVVMHLCDNPPCVRPAHLRIATQQENLQDMRNKGRQRYTGARIPARGIANGNSKLTPEEVLRIRAAYDAPDRNVSQIAREFGVARKQVLNIGRREQWRFLPE